VTLPFVTLIAVLGIVNLIAFWRLCDALLQTAEWRQKWEKSPSWFRINQMSLYQWQVYWAAMSGQFAGSADQAVRRPARVVRACTAVLMLFFVAAVLSFSYAASERGP
jgi:hypothetical protein